MEVFKFTRETKLIKGTTEEDVKDATFSMHPDKSPGPDEFNLAYFKSFWRVVKQDVTKFCQEFMSTVYC